MKKYLSLLPLAMFFTTFAYGQGKVNNIPPAVVYGDRPMKEIGVQQTKLDSIQLKENISLSMLMSLHSTLQFLSRTTGGQHSLP